MTKSKAFIWFRWRQPRTAALLLRLGLAFVFAYAAVAAFRDPLAWEAYVPNFIGSFMDIKLALDLLSVGQLVLAAWLLTGAYLGYAALVAFVLLAGITVANWAAMVITFRDVALAFSALALACLDRPGKQ